MRYPRASSRAMLRATVPRAHLASSASPALLLLAVPDVIFALWTALGLRGART